MKTSSATRIKKSYSISRESEQFIRRVRKSRKIASDSAALDLILKESLDAQRLAALNESYKDYYDSASEADLLEEKEWATLGGTALAALLP